MSLVAEGHGFSITHGALSITQKPTVVQLPGWSKEELDRTTHGNTTVQTAQVSKLKKYGTFTHTFPYDPSDYATWQGDTGGSVAHDIVFPSSAGTFRVYASVMEVGEISQETGDRPTYDVTFLVTNLSGSTETVPSFS